MTVLDVHLEGEGPVGKLRSDENLAIRFAYAEGYSGPALSLRLPISGKSFGDAASRAFFHNLLQEGWRLEQLAARHRIDRNDTAGLLFHLGRECPGALSIVPEGDPPGKAPGDLDLDYIEIPPEQFQRDVAALEARRPPRTRTGFSLAGVQSKMAVTLHPDGRIMEATDGAPTTHILKVGNRDDEALVENEFVCLKTAAALGLPVVDCEMRVTAGISYLLLARYDRAVEGNRVRRLHQEDVCQALGLPPSMKYEKDRDPNDPQRAASFANLFGLAIKTADPLGFRESVIRIAFFNYLIGNSDAHAKNISLLHAGTRPSLAPFYDLVCIALYDTAAQEFAMRIGGKTTWDEVERRHWLAFLEAAGLKGRGRDHIVDGMYRAMAGRILDTIAAVIDAAVGRPSRVRLVRDCVGERLRHLNAVMGWDIPVDTDGFVVRGGGWRMS